MDLFDQLSGGFEMGALSVSVLANGRQSRPHPISTSASPGLPERLTGKASTTLLWLLAVLLLLGAIASVLGITLWISVLVATVCFGLAVAQYASWTMSAAVTTIAALAGIAILMCVYPYTGLTLSANNLLALIAVGLVSLSRLWAARRSLRIPSGAGVLVLGSALVVPAVATIVALVTVVRYHSAKVSWAMGNDSIWNTMSSRFIVVDAGLKPSLHPNPSPLANEIMASIASVGRSRVSAAGLLEHDIAAGIQVMLVLTMISSVLISLAVSRAVSSGRPLARGILSIGAGLIPWTWFIGGFAYRLGFYNVGLATLVLAAVWLIWQETESSPRFGSALLLLSSTAVLATWAPLVLLPCGFAAVSLVWRRRALSGLGRTGWLAWVFSLVQLVVYAALVTGPDLTRDGASLAADGAMIPITEFDVITAVALMIVVATMGVAGHGRRWDLLGAWVATGAGALGIGYLISKRVGFLDVWTYYPAKLGWFFCIFATIVIAVSACRCINPTKAWSWRAVGCGLAAVLAVSVVLIQVPPAGWGAYSLFPALSITRADGMSSHDAEARALFDASDPSAKTMFVRFFPSAEQDAFVDGWLLQQPSQSSQDKLRHYAYFLKRDDPRDICGAISTWGDGVVLRTRDALLTEQVHAACPLVSFSVQLSAPE